MKDIMLLMVGGLITVAVAISIEFLRRPKLTIYVKKPDDFWLAAAKTNARSLKLIVKNEDLPTWMSWMQRSPALQARGSIVFRHLDGRPVFGAAMAARWAGAPEPVPQPILGPDGIALQLLDFERLTSGSRMDIHAGDEEELDAVARIPPDQHCYGWNNESYFPPSVNGRNPKWVLPPGRYLVDATIRSSGQKRTGSFLLINDGSVGEMHLEPIMEKTNVSFLARILNLKPIELFTAVLCVVAGVQAWAFIQSERAFVFPFHVQFVAPLAVAEVQPISLALEMRNTGRSTAKVSNLVAVVTHQLPQVPNYENGLDRGKFAFPPIPGNGQITQELNFRTWGSKTMIEVRDGSRPFYLFGEITYTDDYSFLSGRSSRFCFAYIANRDDPTKANFRNCLEPQYTGTN
jgi:hypothetical protein